MSEVQVTLSQEQRSDFKTRGYAALPRLIDNQGLSELRQAYDTILAGDVDTTQARDSYLGDVTRQVVGAEHCHPLFKANDALAAGYKVARQLLDWEPVFLYSQLLYKPPEHPFATPWHQDAAYMEMPFTPAGRRVTAAAAQFWLALDDADEENGCMHFHPGYGDQVLPHQVASGAADSEARLLGLVEPAKYIDPDRVVACPLPAGCATVHLGGTLHYTPPNVSKRPRRAYIFNFADRAYFDRLQTNHRS